MINACDRVDLPYDGSSGPVTGSGTGIPRNVIVEDFTGFRCVNCPLATEALEQLEGVYGDQLIPVGIHMIDFFCEPQADPEHPGFFLTDFRTPDGQAYENTFEVFGIPVGTVNRTEDNGSLLIGFGAWDGKIGEVLSTPADVDIKIKQAEYNAGSGQIDVQIDALFDNAVDGSHNLTIYLLEDSILEGQYDGSDVLENYLHRHVFRGTLNSTWGDQFFTDASPGDSLRYEGSFSLPSSISSAPSPNPDIDISKCEIVAYIYKSGFDEYEIIQAEKKHVDM